MEDIVDTKGIERVVEEVKEEVAPTPKGAKPKKPRSQAQKDAFEKARLKRQANLAKKKEEEELDAWAEGEVSKELPEVQDIKPPPKKRGRPKKAMNRRPEPQAQPFIQAPDPTNISYPVQGQIPMNPYQQYQYYQPPPQAPAPVNNYYYYGQGQPRDATQSLPEQSVAKEQKKVEFVQRESEPSPDGSLVDSDEEYYADPPDLREQLKYRFA